MDRLKAVWNSPTMLQISHYWYRYFFRYFLDSEVGHFWAIFNGMLSTFTIGFLGLYAMKGWGLRSWNKNLIANKQRFLKIALRRLKEELSRDETEAKLHERKRISALGFANLREKLQRGEISATQAIDAFRWKSLAIHEKFNCVTDFVKEAPQQAIDLDTEYSNKPKPPLFGMPFSVKENFHMPGYDVTMGLSANIEDPTDDEATLVTYLKSLGAIPIVRTIVPQTMISFSCSNPIYGSTRNPHNIDCGPGGSSGGEAVMVATGGCLFGIGSDVGGSLRIPAHCCGIVTLKPTECRLITRKTDSACDGCPRVALCYGFLTKDVQAQKFLLSLVFDEAYFAVHPEAAPLKFDSTLFSATKRLRIGYFWDDGWVEATPSCRRAVEMARDLLQREGHELVPFSVPNMDTAYSLAGRSLFPDNGAYWTKSLEYESIDKAIYPMYLMMRLPLIFRRLLSGILGLLKYKNLSLLLRSYNKDLMALRDTYKEIKAYRRQFLEHWCREKLDAVVCPPLPFTAIPDQCVAQLNTSVSYTLLYNLLDIPSGVVPMTKSTQEDLDEMVKYPRCLLKGERQEKFSIFQDPTYHFIRDAVRQSGLNMPVGVQVVALPFREETCLRVMQLLEKSASFELGL